MPVVINSKYTPFTYDELSKPLIQATEAQMAVEEAYATASDKAAKALAAANAQTDPISYNRLKSYADDLQYQADQLMRNGLQSGSRSALLNMRTRYNNEINPIEEASTRRNELAKEQRAARLTNPSLIFQRDMATTSLDEFLNNPQLDYGTALSGEDIKKRAQAVTTAIGKAKGENLTASGRIDRYTKILKKTSGLTDAQIEAVIAGSEDADEVLSKALQTIYDSTGVGSWNNNEASSAVWNNIYEGARLGAGEVTLSAITDEEAKRADQVADRNLQYAANFMKVNSNGTIDFDYEGFEKWNAAKKAAELGGNAINPNTNKPYKDGELQIHKNGNEEYYVDPNNPEIKLKRLGKNSYVAYESYVASSSSTSNSKKEAGIQKLIAEPILFKGSGTLLRSGKRGQFNKNDAKQCDVSKLTDDQQSYLRGKLAAIGLTIDDVDIYVDNDAFLFIDDLQRDDYMVVPKGYDPRTLSPKTLDESSGSNSEVVENSEPTDNSIVQSTDSVNAAAGRAANEGFY